MKSKYKLKIKEISMRLKNGSVLLLSIFCLFALASAVQAVPWTDPTCAAPDCNTDGPIWVNPEDPQDSNAASTKPMIYIQDTREISTPAASAYVRSALDGKPAIYGYGLGNNSLSYGGEFKADYAPGLKVSGGVIVDPLGLDPTDYQVAGLLYLNSGSYANQFRYYSGGSWRTLNPWINAGNELYYSLAAGNARGVAIKNGDLTGPNDAYTLDVYRKTSTDADPAYYAERALYARLASYSSDANYASGFIGGYDSSGNLIGVRGKVDTSSTQPHYGGYFEATGPTGYAVYGIASNSGATMNVGGTFSALGTSGIGVTGGAPAYGGYFQATGTNGVGVAAFGPSTPTTTAYAIRTNDGAIAMGEIATIPDAKLNYGMLYVKQDGSDNKIYFRSEGNVTYDLTAGSGSATIDNGTAAGQMNYWNGSKWTYTDTSDLVWDNTNKNMGIGVAAPSHKLHVVNSTSTGYVAAVSGVSSATGSLENYGGYFSSASDSGMAVVGLTTGSNSQALYGQSSGVEGYGVRGIATSASSGSYVNAGGWFNSAGINGRGVYGEASATGAVTNYGGYFVAAGQTGMAVYGNASSNTGVNYGGYFTTSSTTANAAAVYGNATGTSGQIYGGRFETASTTGRGVYARATATGATTNYGGFFVAAGDNSYAIYGLGANNTTAWAGYFDGRAGVGQSLYIGQASGTDNDYLYFDAGAESLMWDNTASEFALSDDLSVTGSLTASQNVIATGNVNGVNIVSSGYLMTDGNLYLDYDVSSTTDTIYMSNAIATSDYIRYTSTTDVFSFTGGLNIPNADSASLPGYSWTGDTDNGMYYVGTNSIGFATAGTARLTISATGILTAPATYNTTVGATNRDLYIDNTGVIGYVSSSLRYKDNVQDMEDISWLYQLRPVNFTYKNDEGKAKQYGLIAEEVEKVNPFFVSYDEEGLPETVSYSALVTPIIKAIQTQKQQLDILETKVEMIEKNGCANNEAALMEYIEKLEARIEALEAKNAAPVKTSFWSKLW